VFRDARETQIESIHRPEEKEQCAKKRHCYYDLISLALRCLLGQMTTVSMQEPGVQMPTTKFLTGNQGTFGTMRENVAVM
jgi:hypothetical protein